MPVHYPVNGGRYHDLMPHRIREVLLVSSPYDAFILQEDAQLTERIYFEYRDIRLGTAPRFTQVSSGEAALESLKDRRYDLVLVMSNPGDLDINAFGRQVKELRPGRPVVLLALNRHELRQQITPIDRQVIDGTFFWTGDADILLAIMKYIEDRENLDHDVVHGNIRVIILVEDSVRYYSTYLGMLYKELMAQSHALYVGGLNEQQRYMKARTRPKILLATDYEEGLALFEEYRRNVMAVISDIRMPRKKALDRHAGFALAQVIRQKTPDTPLLLQSAEPENEAKAEELGVSFAHKGSPTLLRELRQFLRFQLGFGDFVFRTSDDEEVDRAKNLTELEEKIAEIPVESLQYHASHGHFSIWLVARSEFELADRLHPASLGEFQDPEVLRKAILRNLKESHERLHVGVISDFREKHFDHDVFSRIGEGALGGKARGIAFMHQTLADTDDDEFGGLEVRFPKSAVVTTDFFDDFLDRNDLREFAISCTDDREIEERFFAGDLRADLVRDLNFLLGSMTDPLAVRSSSLLEDSLHQPFAGIYNTFLLPNNASDQKTRLKELLGAIKLVYASTFFRNTKAYLATTQNRAEEEKMAVIIQRLVGRPFKKRFYPNFAGVAQSYNFYPVGPQKAEEGVVQVALGLGHFVVSGELALRFNPKRPGVMPPHASAKKLLDNSQHRFCAVDLESTCAKPVEFYETVKYFNLRSAEEDGTLAHVGSVFSTSEQRVREDLSIPGPRLVTFNNILRHRLIPLAEALDRVLRIARQGFDCAVEIEFACDLGDLGKPRRRGVKREKPVLYVLQVRPLAALSASSREIVEMDFTRDQSLCYSETVLGHGVKTGLYDVVYVRRDKWDPSRSQEIAEEVGRINEMLGEQGRRFILIGPGRWGTTDERLGIPVQWAQISNTKVIVEASPGDFHVDPSQGSHFFQNMTALRIGYFTLPAGADASDPGHGEFMDWDWLDAQSARTETEHLRHVSFAEPLLVVINGQTGCGVIAKAGVSAPTQGL